MAESAPEISPIAEQPPVSESKLKEEPEEHEHKRKLENPEEKLAEIEASADDVAADAKRQKLNGSGDADGFGVDGVQDSHNLVAPVVENGQPPSTEDVRPESVDFPHQSEVISEQNLISSEGQDVPSSRKIEVANDKVGVLIGKGGETIRNIQNNSGAKIQIAKDKDVDRSLTTRPVELVGTSEQINKAEKLIKDVIAEADAGGRPALAAQGLSASQLVSEEFDMLVPNEKVGRIIGKGGETIRNLQATSGAQIQIIPQHLPEGDLSKERTVRITGNKRQIEVAQELVKEVMDKLGPRAPSLSGGQSQGSRSRGSGPAQQWGPPPSQHQHQYPPQHYGGGYPQQPPPQQRYNAPMQPPPTGGYNNYYGQGGPGMGTQPSQPAAYGHPQQPTGYGQQNPYPQSAPPQHSYGPGYNEPAPQSYGQQPYTGGPPPSYSGQQPDPNYQPPVQSYGSVGPTQQPAPAYSQSYGPPAPGYAQPGYSQPAAQPTYAEQPTYGAPAATAGYGAAPAGSQAGYAPPAGGYAQPPPATNPAGYAAPAGGYGPPPPANPASYPPQAGGYVQPPPTANPVSYDQSGAAQYGYGSQPGSAPVGYAKGAPPQTQPQPQPGAYGGWAT